MAKIGKAATEAFSDAVMEKIWKWSEIKETGLSLRYMIDFESKTLKNLLLSAQFLHRELPIRLAGRAVELDSLPHGLSQKPPVLKIRDCYLESFREVQSFPKVRDKTDELNFTQMIKLLRARRKNIVPTMPVGVQQLKKELNQTIINFHPLVTGTYPRTCILWMELVKNSLRAVQEQFVDSDENEPYVRIAVADGIEDATMKVCTGTDACLHLSRMGDSEETLP